MIVYNNIWFGCVKETSRTFHLGAKNFCLIEETQVLIFGIHDIWSKTILSKRRLVECDIWSIRRFIHYVIWSNMTIGRIFVEIRRNSSKFGRKLTCTEKNVDMFVFLTSNYRVHLLPINMMVYPF